MGDGANIRVFLDRWVPRPSSFCIVTAGGNDTMLVKEPILGPGLWNNRRINEVLLRVDSQLVKSIPLSIIPLSIMPRSDYLAWFYDKKGEYSVKSGSKCRLRTDVRSHSMVKFGTRI